MRANTVTKLSLYEFARILGINPLHFAGVKVDAIQNVHCNRPYPQYAWQDNDRVAREDISIAIQEAETVIERELGYRLLPSWEEAEWHEVPRPWRKDLVNISGMDVRGFANFVKADWGHVVTGGVRAATLLGAGAAVTYAADGYWRKGTATVAVPAGTNPCEIRAYYPGHSGEDEWEIRPLEVTVAGLVATVKVRQEVAVDEVMWEALQFTAADGDDATDADFLATVDIYRVYNDPQTQVTLRWLPVPGCGCGSESCAQCSYSNQTGCFVLSDEPRLGLALFSPGTWDAASQSFSSAPFVVDRQPDIVLLYYLAGLQSQRADCPRRTLDEAWARSIAYLAAARLDRPPCDCNPDAWERWREDLSEGAKFQVQAAQLDNPFGTRRGEVYAWNRVISNGQAIGRGVFA